MATADGQQALDTQDQPEVVLACKNIVKDYGRIQALKGVSFELRRGEILGLIGDNGAGKSTLVKIIRGALPATSGTIMIAGRKRRFRSPRGAIRAGIQCVYQESALVEQLSVRENFFLGQEPVKPGIARALGLVDFGHMQRETDSYLKRMGFDLDVRDEIGNFSGGQRQAVSVMRALYFNPHILLLDEPLAALSEKAKDRLQRFLLEVRDVCPMILVTHDFKGAVDICDQMIILKHGLVAGEISPSESDLSKEQVLDYLFAHM